MQWIARQQPAIVGDAEWTALLTALAPVSPGYLRRLLRESGTPLAPLVEGVRQESLEACQASLIALLHEYERGDTTRRSEIRRLIIEAKDHARWAARRNPEIRATREEMALWMLTWLENPPLFREWTVLRKQRLEKERA